MTLQAEQAPIDLEIINALLDAIPADWNSALLEVQSAELPKGQASVKLSILSPENHRDYVEPGSELFAAARKLVLLMKQYGQQLKLATYKAELTPEEDWAFHSKFEYY